METFPKRVVLKRTHTSAHSHKEKGAKHSFKVFFDGGLKTHFVYYVDANISHNIIRDLRKLLHISNRDMHKKFLNKELAVTVEFNEHIAFSIKPSSSNFEHSQWVFFG